MHKGRPTFTRPRYYLYIEPQKGGLKCTVARHTHAGTVAGTVAGTTEGGTSDE